MTTSARARKLADAPPIDLVGELPSVDVVESVRDRAMPFAWTSAGDLASRGAPSAIPWVVRELQIVPGRPAILYGPAGVAKTLVATSLGIAVAAGLPAFGRFAVTAGRRLRVRLVDYELGPLATELRVRAIARGLGLDLDQLGDRFAWTCFPPTTLARATAEREWRRGFAGIDLAIVDALRGATRADENDPRLRDLIDVLARVSTDTGAAFVLIHHANAGGQMRGTTAIEDAGGVIVRVSGREGQPKEVRCEKPAQVAAGPFPPFALRVAGTAYDAPDAWVRVLHGDAQPMADLGPDDRVLAFLTTGAATARAIRDGAAIPNGHHAKRVLARLLEAKKVRVVGDRFELAIGGGDAR